MSIPHNPLSPALPLSCVRLSARITLKNPPLNVIDVRMMDELRAALEQIEVASGN